MIDETVLNAGDYVVVAEAEADNSLNGLGVELFGGEVFSDEAVVCVREFYLIVVLVEEVVHVHVVYVPRDSFEVNVLFVFFVLFRFLILGVAIGATIEIFEPRVN